MKIVKATLEEEGETTVEMEVEDVGEDSLNENDTAVCMIPKQINDNFKVIL